MAHAYSMYFGGRSQFNPTEAVKEFLHELDHGYLADRDANRADLEALMRAFSAVADPNLSADEIIDRWEAESIENRALKIIEIIAESFRQLEQDRMTWHGKLPQLRAAKAKYRAEAAPPLSRAEAPVLPKRKRGRPSNAERAAIAAAAERAHQ